jgi:phosphatidylglycerophosphate synthase
MIETLDLIVRILILYFLTVAGHVGALRGKKWLSWFIFPMWLLYFRLSVLRILSLEIGAVQQLTAQEIRQWILFLQTGTIVVIVDLIFLAVIILLYRDLRIKK